MNGWDELVGQGFLSRDVELAGHTTYKLGGPARLFAEVGDDADLMALSQTWKQDPMPMLVLGRGSNLLVADSGFDGLVVHLSNRYSTIDFDQGGVVEAGGSAPLPRLARSAASTGRGGLEWCVGVPGSVGGAVRQNAGCFGSETVDRLIDCRVLVMGEREIVTRPASSLELGYRRSSLSAHEIVTSARFSTVPTDPEAASVKMKEITRWRRDHQPGGTLNAGSVFKNPDRDAAGRIVEEVGLKGFALSGVRVSPRHANFIEAGPDAAAADVKRLIESVADRVEAATGIRLIPEIQFVGFGD